VNTHVKHLCGLALLALVLSSESSLAAADHAPPDAVLFNGKIFTADAAHPYVQALAIRGGRILAVGDSNPILAAAGPNTRRIDLEGRTVIPGINDAHQHLSVSPSKAVGLRWQGGDPSWPEVRKALLAAARRAPPGSQIFGEIGPAIVRDPRVRRDLLDHLVPEHPVILTTFHVFVLNSAALTQLGIDENEPNPKGGYYERSPDGRLNGVAWAYAAMALLRKRANLTDREDAVSQLREVLEENARLGITTVQDMADEVPPERALDLLTRVPTAIRVRIIRMPLTSPAGRDLQEGRGLPRIPSSLITVSGTKWKLDGNPFDGARAKDIPPGEPPLWALELTFPETEMEAMLKESLKNKDPLLLHVSGTPAARAMLYAMERTGGPGVWASRRVRFEHGDGVLPDLIPRLKAMGVVVVQNPTHLDLGRLPARHQLGPSQPLRSLLAAGIPVALASDGPRNPYLNIMLACTHPDRPTEALTREQAVIAYTLTSAYAEFSETDKGSLEAGKLADLAVLSQDIFTVPLQQLPKTVSLLTLVGGATVYDAKVLQAR
jgi:hypothetical protein